MVFQSSCFLMAVIIFLFPLLHDDWVEQIHIKLTCHHKSWCPSYTALGLPRPPPLPKVHPPSPPTDCTVWETVAYKQSVDKGAPFNKCRYTRYPCQNTPYARFPHQCDPVLQVSPSESPRIPSPRPLWMFKENPLTDPPECLQQVPPLTPLNAHESPQQVYHLTLYHFFRFWILFTFSSVWQAQPATLPPCSAAGLKVASLALTQELAGTSAEVARSPPLPTLESQGQLAFLVRRPLTTVSAGPPWWQACL